MEDGNLSFTSSPHRLITTSRNSQGRNLGWLIAALVLVGAAAARAFPPSQPFDPRPLMRPVQQHAKSGRFRFVGLGDSTNNPPFPGVLERTAALTPDFAISTGDLVERGAGARGQEEYDRLAEVAGGLVQR